MLFSFSLAEAAISGVSAKQWAAIAAARHDPSFTAEDALQDVLLAVLEGRADPSQNVAGWAFRAAVREGWRRQRVFSVVSADGLCDFVASPEEVLPLSRTAELDTETENILDLVRAHGIEALALKLNCSAKTATKRLINQISELTKAGDLFSSEGW